MKIHDKNSSLTLRNFFTKALLLVAIISAGTVYAADPVWIDVRTPEEYKESHIKGDELIEYENIVDGVSKLYPEKDTEIHLYCRSGRRAGIAKEALEEQGYTNVSNDGGIVDVRKARGLN